MFDIVIIGAGPAGLTAGIYGIRANKKVLVLEAMSYGGQIINASKVDNYPGLPHISGVEFATNLYNQATDLGVEIKYEKAIDIILEGNNKIVKTTNNEYKTKTVIIATGTRNKTLGLEEESNYIGKGLSYCATCDGNFYKNKDVAIYCDPDKSTSNIEYLNNIVNKLYVINSRDTKITKIEGNNKIESITTNDGKTFNIDGLFIEIGRIPESNNLVKNIKLTNNGYVDSKEDTHTNIEGIFVAGDIRNKNLRQLTTACSDGSNAATEAIKYINTLK